MELIAGLESNLSLVLLAAVALCAGIVKGTVGFAMPTVLMSGLTLVLPPDQALGALILPTLLTNLWQALRQGMASAWQTIFRFRVFLVAGGLCLMFSAQLVPVLDVRWLFGLIGAPIAVFAIVQLAGWRPRLSARRPGSEATVGALTGLIGGVSGIWGPPTVTYLTAIGVPKAESMRAQGVIYGLGAVALAGAHSYSGVLTPEILPVAFLIVPTALLGLWIGFKIQDRLAQETFRKVILCVLILAGLNLLRRALVG